MSKTRPTTSTKPHPCRLCGAVIDPGETHYAWTVADQRSRAHAACRAYARARMPGWERSTDADMVLRDIWRRCWQRDAGMLDEDGIAGVLDEFPELSRAVDALRARVAYVAGLQAAQ